MALSPSKIPTISQMLAHPWMQGPTSSDNEILTDFARRKNIVDVEARRERDQKRLERQEAQASRAVRRGTSSGAEEADLDSAGFIKSLKKLTVYEFGPVLEHSSTQFFMSSSPLDYFDDLCNYLDKAGVAYRISGSSLKLKY